MNSTTAEGNQVGLGKVSGARGVCGDRGVDTGGLGDGAAELLDALGLLEHAAELLLEGNLGKTAAELSSGTLRSSS